MTDSKALVTQADREAAAAVSAVFQYSQHWADEIRRGVRDETALVQAFARHRITALSEAIEALEPFARCPTHGKHGGPFVIANAVYEDMTNGGSAPREAYWHAEDFARARTLTDKLKG